MRASLAIPFFCLAASITPSFAVSMGPDRPFKVARSGAPSMAGETFVETAAKGAGKINFAALKDAAISNMVAAGVATGLGTLSHSFLPLQEKQQSRDVLELLEERINQELSTREYRRDLLVTLLDNLD